MMKINFIFMMAMLATFTISGCRKAVAESINLEKLSLPENVTLEMVKINSGSFKREWNLDKISPELRKNIQSYYTMEINLTKPYWIGKFEVTQAQYQAVMGKNPSVPQGDTFPVNNIRWQEAKNFCNELNRLYAGKLPAGYQFDLPSEAQWEYAAHAGNYADPGYQNMMAYAWYKDNCDDIQAVGKKMPNAWGIYDMSGNVAEWCRDFYHEYFTRDERNTSYSCWKVTNPVGMLLSDSRVHRGGSFSSPAVECWKAVRKKEINAGKIRTDRGFRVALVPIEKGVQKTMNFTLDNGSSLEMVLIESGVQNSFWIGKYEITQEVFTAIMGYNPSKIQGKKNPVDSVGHDEALFFCKKLTEYFHHQLPERYIFHLPFTYMWEYACQAGTTSPYNCGYDSVSEKIDLNNFIWHKENSSKGHNPVGGKHPNNWGLHDMHGNVREWCFVTDLPDAKNIVRGGGWRDDLSKCTSKHEEQVKENQKSDDLGFRVILVERHIMDHY